MNGRHWRVKGGVGGINGHARNRENRRQQHSENRSVHVATIGALFLTPFILLKTRLLDVDVDKQSQAYDSDCISNLISLYTLYQKWFHTTNLASASAFRDLRLKIKKENVLSGKLHTNFFDLVLISFLTFMTENNNV